MITKLRRNFIFITMCSTFAVLAVIIGTLNIVSYRNMVQKADSILELLAENDAVFPEQPAMNMDRKEPMMEPPKPGTERDRKREMMMEMSPETPFETRFFSVRLDDEGGLISVDTGKIAAVATEDAVSLAKEIWESGSTKGFYRTYRYRVTRESGNNMIVFIDRSREMASYQTLATTSVSVAVLGLAAVFMLVVIFSKIVFRPVAISYEKQKRFITDASHELKTPLTIISANVEVLEMVQEENEWSRSIRNQVSRMNGLVEQMVTLSRMDEESALHITEHFSLSEAVTETAEYFKTLAESKEKELIQISLLQKGRHYHLKIWNTVDDIPKGNLDILFERFYRLDSSRNSQTGGSGIGLSIVKSIAEAHKGKVHAKSDDGKSLEIMVTL